MPNLQVVLIANTPKLGSIGDVKNVSAGYARNYLFPRKLAVAATSGRLADVGFQKDLEQRRLKVQREVDEHLAQSLQGKMLVIHTQVGAQGRMHGQITNQDVATAIEQQLGVVIDRHKIQIDSPIRSLGRYLLPIRIGAGLEASITLEVAERIDEPEPAPVAETAPETEPEPEA